MGSRKIEDMRQISERANQISHTAWCETSEAKHREKKVKAKIYRRHATGLTTP